MIGQGVVAQRMMGQLSENEAIQGVTATLADVEARLSDAVNGTLDVADQEDVTIEMDAEERQAELLDLIEAVMSDSVEEWWFENVAPDVLDNPKRARQYIGMDAEEWDEQIEKWYRTYHERDAVDTPLEDASTEAIAQVAEVHVETTFGVCFDQFVREIVDWDKAEVVRRQLTKPVEQNRQAIMILRGVIEEQNERIEELEGDGDE